ncbi:peptidoglycan-binding domain-containing protein [Hyalangium versicolor]|uniref:peptidoglycan-binding domain-containing protein n=1 Tax=Hyalangium versicolor TaxID=2861190 RepID=UPI001CCB5FE9|nr:peptidoglycan-binding domain-containing protein [Hyalangium versicolor]
MPRKHIVRPGECLTKIAWQYGFADYKTVYEHASNAELRKKRPNPNILHPGDEVSIPDPTPKKASVSTGKMHRFQVRRPKKMLSLKLRDHEGQPLANEPYVLELDGEPELIVAQTDGEGGLQHFVPLSCTQAVLTLRDRTLRLRLGYLNPARDAPQDDVSGVQARLRNLGYHIPRQDGLLDPATRAALAVFQADEGLDFTGEPDATTLNKLEERHGC